MQTRIAVAHSLGRPALFVAQRRQRRAGCVRHAVLLVLGLWLAPLVGCQFPGLAAAPTATPTPSAPLVFYDWADELPPTLFDAFTAETGIPVEYRGYGSIEEGVANLRAGEVYDVVVVETRFIPPLLDEQLLAPIERRWLTNFKNLPLNFRGLTFDPGNRYSIPYSWGTAGLAVRPDLAAQAITSWNDLWDPALAGKVGIWRGGPREAIALTLKALGCSANSEDPEELARAEARLLELRPTVQFGEEWDPYSMAPALAQGAVALSLGYASEVRAVREAGLPAEYVLPREGALLWSDNFVIPATSTRQADAARLIDYLLRPEVAAQIVEQTYMQVANDAVVEVLPAALRDDPLIFAPAAQLENAEILLPLSAEGEARYAEIWDAFLGAR